jgi:ferredoxin-fold anticodon binding domain-containing protein
MYSSPEGLPEWLKVALPPEALKFFYDVYVAASKNYDDDNAFNFAWEATKMKMTKSNGMYVVHNHYYTQSEPEDLKDLTTLDMDSEDTKITMNAETDEIIMEAVLADNHITTDVTDFGKPKFFTEEELQSIADQINVAGSTLPDVDHETLKKLCMKHGLHNIEAIRAELHSEKGIFRNIKATVDKGKLWIQAILDKRYKNHVNKFKALSIETLTETEQETGRMRNPKYLGFTFTNNPKSKNAMIAG